MQVPPLWCKYAVGESMLLGSIVCAVGSHTAGGFGPSCKWGTYELICTSGGIPRSKKKNLLYAAETLRQIGDTADSVRAHIEIYVRREPVGVVAIISPWNFPTATAVWKIAPALAFGNAVIWKPANLVPAWGCQMAGNLSRPTQ